MQFQYTQQSAYEKSNNNEMQCKLFDLITNDKQKEQEGKITNPNL